ncbi:hypothetical protein G7077_06175 [Sphingomonas piscis]|uniref:Uncharacterized protein n=1 Tax=Sphingomonas piscis TaxID=2714943 RepID=A0A6G7YP90_9SPHN|nr:hypothetical protein [Sphingomonas piscis]QIK78547.1 hypothetical protein G7077_06175 [Sphingomonas piscis]
MSTSLAPATSARLWIAGYFVATFGSGLLAKTGVIPGWPGIALFLASFLLLFPLVRSVQRAQAECGMNSKAMRAYNRRVVIASMVYVAALFGTIAFAHSYAPPPAVRIVLAIIVATPVMFIIRAMVLLLREETDEYLRMLLVEQALLATGFLLTVGTLYGFLNAFDLAPRIDAYWVVPVWALGLGVGRLFRRDRAC